jgi:integrase
MARQGNKLSSLQVEKLVKKTTKPTWFSDGLGLYLMVRREGDASWTFVYKFNKRRSFLGLGPVHTVSLAEARARAADARKLILDGKDPLAVRKEARAALTVEAARTKTFADCVSDFLQTQRLTQFKNDKHRAQWHSTLQAAVKSFGNLPMQTITSAVVLDCLKPIMLRTPETATRLRGRIERVFSWAAAHEYFSGINPASRDVLRDALPAKPKAKHHKAMPYADLPAFMGKLSERDGVSARALEFTILAAARTGEVIGARWSEIDLKAATWTIPGNRMKAGKAHTVPLSDRAIAILKAIPRSGDFIFINGGGRPISNMAMAELLKGMDVACTVHGFRSSFSDWAHERTAYPKHVIDMALAHTIGDKVEAAYRRGDLLSKRVQLMAAWAEYCGRGDARLIEGDVVVPIRA